MKSLYNEILKYLADFSAQRWLNLLQILFVFYALGQILLTMWWTSPTTDEGRHFEWSRKIIESRNVTREINSVTQAPIINVLSSYLEPLISENILKEEHKGQREWFFRRLGTLLWFLLLIFGCRALLKYSSLPYADTLAVAFLSTDPIILANSALVTVDIAFAAMVLWFIYFAFKYGEKTKILSGSLLGLSFASLFLTKFTAILFIPFYLFTLLLPLFRKVRGKSEVSYTKIFAVTGISIFCFFLFLNLSYLFIEVRCFLSEYQIQNSILSNLRLLLPDLFLPLPQSFIDGIDQCLSHERNVMWNVIFNNKWYPNGSAWYFPFMYLYKNTSFTLIILFFALYLMFKDGIFFSQKIILSILVFSLFYFIFIFKTQVGIRYIIFTLPLIYVLVSLSIARRLNLSRMNLLCLLIFVNSLVCLYPNRGLLLTYFNPSFVPAQKPYLYLVDSNFDWDGTLYQFQDEEKRRGDRFRVFNPTILQPGVNIYSTNYLSGVYGGLHKNQWVRENLTPEQRIAQTYFRFDVRRDEYLRFVEATRQFEPVKTYPDNCSQYFKVGADTKQAALKLNPDEVVCVEVLKTGTYLVKSKEYKQNLGISSPIDGCDFIDSRPEQYIPFYFLKGNNVLCSSKGYEGVIYHVNQVLTDLES